LQIAGLRPLELQLLIDDRKELAEVQHIVFALFEVLDNLVNLLLRERDPQLSVQFCKLARAEELIARPCSPFWGVARSQIKVVQRSVI
jgi:hypothetical protein